MREYQSLNHTKWNCKYPVVFIDMLVVADPIVLEHVARFQILATMSRVILLMPVGPGIREILRN